mgnify:CR=1 FL=1
MASLTLAETKGVCSIAYDGVKDDRYRFPDGTTWKVAQHWGTTSTGFKAVIAMPESRSDVYVMSFAGTDDLQDLITDGQQLVGMLPAQYTQALNWARNGFSAAGSIFVLAGHSLGGGLATYCSVSLKSPAFTVNPAPLVGAASRAALGSNSQITNYVADWELVHRSPGRNPGVTIVVPSTRHCSSYRSFAGQCCSFNTFTSKNRVYANTARTRIRFARQKKPTLCRLHNVGFFQFSKTIKRLEQQQISVEAPAHLQHKR